MPLAKVERAIPDVRVAATALLESLRAVDPAVPVDVVLPDLGPTGQSALLAVLGGDWLDAVRARGDVDPEAVHSALIDLRHALP